MCLYSLGYNAIAPQSETTYISEDIIKDITSRFSNIYILFDNDDTGRKGAYMLNSYLTNSKIVFLENEYKDVSDYYKAMGRGKTIEIVSKMLKHE